MHPPMVPPRTSSKGYLELDDELQDIGKEGKKLKKSMTSLNRWIDPVEWYSVQRDICENQLEYNEVLGDVGKYTTIDPCCKVIDY